MSEILERLREQLDDADGRLVQALADRFALIERVASLKKGGTGLLRDLAREHEVYARLEKLARDAGLDGSLVTRLYREIIAHSLRLQGEHLTDRSNAHALSRETQVVAFQGTDGAYSQLAAQKHFGPMHASVTFKGCHSFQEVAEAVQSGAAHYGVLPVENTTAGSINEAYDLLAERHLWIVGEVIEAIDHCLLGLPDADLGEIRRVLSHPQALAQCSRFLSTLSDCSVEAYTDTAMAAQKVQEDGDPLQAAIASEEAGRRYSLKVLRRRISNQAENYTRFFIVANQQAAYPVQVPCKTSIVFALRHEVGALASCLALLARRGLNLTKLESRPRPNSPWEYLFYVDFEGNLADSNVTDVLRELTGHTNYVKVFGSYPAHPLYQLSAPTAPRAAAAATTAAVAPGSKQEGAATRAPKDEAYRLASRATRREDTQVVVDTVIIGGQRPVVIAGPCAVESREQILQCARAVKELGGDILRGGCFKPRTSPYAFQGLGLEGLDLLEEAGRRFDLPVVTEVLHPSDVATVARKVDILQIGARNMQNFALLKEVGSTDCPVILKRGMMSSIDEWLSAAEYILSHGNQQVVLCERGIRTFETATRSTLDLAAVPVVRERSHLPVIVDPSHACGTWRWVPQMAAAALACGAQGIMVEIHPQPEEALSDGPQALKFEAFEGMMRTVRESQPLRS